MAVATDNFKVLSRLSIFVEDILSQTINYLTGKFDQNRVVFTAASPFGQLLLVLENLTQLVFYYVEDSITELNINEATRLTSIYSLAALSGHRPSRSVSAIGEITLVTKPESVDADYNFVIIPNHTRLRCLNNGLTYILDLPQDEVRFNYDGNDNNIKLAIRQGTIETQTVTGRGVLMDSFSIGNPQNFFVDNFFVNAYVNGEKWKNYSSILDMPRGEKCFHERTGITSGLDIFFGNNNFGKVPPRGSKIDIEYLVTEGANGNIRTNDPDKVKFEFIDTGFTIIGDEVDLNEYIQIRTTHSPYFGADAEHSELTRLIAPNQSKSFALVNETHYEVTLRKLKLFSIINVFLDEFDDRILNLFLIPDIRKTLKTAQDYFNADLDMFVMSDYQKNELLKYLEKSGSKLISTDPIILDPIVSKYVVNITIVAFDDVDPEIIKRDIHSAIGSFFINNTRRNRVPKSDLIKIVEEVNGVDSVSINLISEKNELTHIANPKAKDSGLDEFNDIIISKFELPLIRGGFTDRYGNGYSEGLSNDSLGSVNIQIKEISPRPKNLVA